MPIALLFFLGPTCPFCIATPPPPHKFERSMEFVLLRSVIDNILIISNYEKTNTSRLHVIEIEWTTPPTNA